MLTSQKKVTENESEPSPIQKPPADKVMDACCQTSEDDVAHLSSETETKQSII